MKMKALFLQLIPVITEHLKAEHGLTDENSPEFEAKLTAFFEDVETDANKILDKDKEMNEIEAFFRALRKNGMKIEVDHTANENLSAAASVLGVSQDKQINWFAWGAGIAVGVIAVGTAIMTYRYYRNKDATADLPEQKGNVVPMSGRRKAA